MYVRLRGWTEAEWMTYLASHSVRSAGGPAGAPDTRCQRCHSNDAACRCDDDYSHISRLPENKINLHSTLLVTADRL